MPFALNGTALARARLTVPRHFGWEGTATTAQRLDLTIGQAVALSLGDQDFVGYVLDGGTFPGATESTYIIGAGAAGWSKPVPARGYGIPAGVKLFDVLSALAADAGERFDLTGISQSAVLGDHWQRPASPASVALSALFPLDKGGWRIDPDGLARAGVRPPAPLPSGTALAVEKYEPQRRWARIGSATDQVSALLPGAIVTSDNLAAPIVVMETTILASADAVTVEILGEGGLLEQLAALVQVLTPPAPLTGLYRYQVVGADTGAPNLKALQKGIPQVISSAKAYGLPGATATLAAGAVVVVAFLDGSPSKPIIVCYLSGVDPTSVEVDAGTFTVGRATTIALGGTSTLALAQPLIGWAAGINLALIAAGHPAPALSGTVASTIVKGA